MLILAIKIALVVVTFVAMPNPSGFVEIAPFKNEIQQIQPIKADESLQPLQELKLVVENKKPPSGSHQDWMIAAGIQSGDFVYVEYIISHESGWRPDAINKSSGACGLVQALPCSKLGADWSNPIVALQWGDRYANARYGSWAEAHAFWVANHWW